MMIRNSRIIPTLSIHGFDGIPQHICILSPSYRNSKSDQHLIAIREGNRNLVFSIQWNEAVKKEDIVLSISWYYFLKNQHNLSVVDAEIYDVVQDVSEIAIQPIGFFSVTSVFNISDCKYHFPSGLRSSILKAHISKLLFDSIPVIDGSILLIPVLDCIMLAKCMVPVSSATNPQQSIYHINNTSHINLLDISSTTIKIKENVASVKDTKHRLLNKMTPTLKYISSLSYLRNPLSHIMHTFELLSYCTIPAKETIDKGNDKNVISNRGGSILLQGFAGTGKTYLFQYLSQYYQEQYPDLYDIVHIDCLMIKEQHHITPLSFDTHLDTNILLQKLIEMTSLTPSSSMISHEPNYQNQFSSISSKPIVILLVDHLDLLLQLFDEQTLNNQNSSLNFETYNEQYLHIFAYYLRALLLQLHTLNYTSMDSNGTGRDRQYETNENKKKIIVLGACRMPISQLPRSHRGCPEFLNHLLLSKPSYEDRVRIIHFLLSHFSSDIFPVWISSTAFSTWQTEQERDLWSHKIALLTRGYLPGDLSRIIHKFQLLVQEPSEHETSSSSSTANALEMMKFLWKSMMTAVASVVPSSLDDFEVEVHSNELSGDNHDYHHQQHQEKEEEKVSSILNKIIGYDNMKHQLQRIVRSLRSKQQLSQPKQSQIVNTNILSSQLPVSKGMVLYGPSGCGKSYIVKYLASEVNLFVASILILFNTYFAFVG
jgi:Cdc6-like AAA superfamily ATPase